MTQENLDSYLGKEVIITFKDGTTSTGKLGFTEEFSQKHGFRKPGYYTCGSYDFKQSHVRSIGEARIREAAEIMILDNRMIDKAIEKAEVKESEPSVKTVVLEPDVSPENLENDEGIQYCVGPSEDRKGIIISVYSKDHCIRLNNKTDLRNLVDAIIEASQMEE